MKVHNYYNSLEGFTDSLNADVPDVSKIQEIIDSLEAAISMTYHLDDLAESILPAQVRSAIEPTEDEEPGSKFNKAHALAKALMGRVQSSHTTLNRIHRDLVG